MECLITCKKLFYFSGTVGRFPVFYFYFYCIVTLPV